MKISRMKRLLSLLLSLLLIMSTFPVTIFATDGATSVATLNNDTLAEVESTDVAKIGDTGYADLHAALIECKAGETVELLSNVTLTGEWTPVDDFKGTFDGKGYTISGLTITQGTGSLGLFANINSGKVKNFTVDGANISGATTMTGQNIGVVAGYCYTEISNVTVTNATVNTNGKYVGGLVGNSTATVKGCTVKDSSITGKDQVGGVAGYMWCGEIDSCTSENNTVIATEERAGGLIGKLQCASGNDSYFSVQNNTVKGGSATAPDLAGGVMAQLMGDMTNYEIKYNSVSGISLTANETNPIATLRTGNGSDFDNTLSTNITGNSWTKDVYNKNSFTYTNVASGASAQTINNATPFADAVAQIGDTKYETLAAAIAAVPTNGTETTITMIADVDYGDVCPSGTTDAVYVNDIASGKNVVLDLNGHTIKASRTGAKSVAIIHVTNGGKLTVNDETQKGSIELYCGAETDPWDVSSSAIISNGEVVINGGLIKSTEQSGSYAIDVNQNGFTDETKPVSITINGGELSSTYVGLRFFANGGNLITGNVTGGTISGGKKGLWVHQSSSTGSTKKAVVNISGGYINSENGNAVEDWYLTTNGAEIEINITGGHFMANAQKAVVAMDTDAEKVAISAGYFNLKPAEKYIASGYEVASNTGSDSETYPYTVAKDTSFYEDENGVYHITNLNGLKAFRDQANAKSVDFSGKTIVLDADIDLNNEAWTPINTTQDVSITFDGQGHTVKNFTVTGEKMVGFFGDAACDTIKNLVVENATVTGINHVAAVAGYGLCTHIINCTVKNAIVTTNVCNNDDGDKAGAICGYLSGESTAEVTNCTVDNCTIRGYRDIGGAVGYANGTASVTGNTITNTTVINDQENNYKEYDTDEKFDANKVVGETTSTSTVSDNIAGDDVVVVIANKKVVVSDTKTAEVNEETQTSNVTVGAEAETDLKNFANDEKTTAYTKVSGVKLSDIPTVEVSNTEAKTGLQAVVDAAKVDAEKESNTDFTKAIGEEAINKEVTIKVEVTVIPTEYKAATSATSGDGKIAFELNPTATVTVINKDENGETTSEATQSNVEVTNDMIDQSKNIAVSIYTGFKPAQIIHADDEGNVIDVFNESDIVYDSDNGVATVYVSHFSMLYVSQAAEVATDGKTTYATLAAAVAAAENGDTITLLESVDVTTDGLTISKDITIDLNGFDIKAGEQATNNITVATGGKLTLKDTSKDADGKIYTEENYTKTASAGVVRVAGTFVMESGNIEAVMSDVSNYGQFGIVETSGADVTIKGGQVKAGWYAITNNASTDGATTKIEGGTLISTGDYAIYNPAKNSNVTVSGGTVYGEAGGIAMFQGTLNITGGTVTSRGQGSTGTWGDGTGNLSNAAIYVGTNKSGYGNVTATISGGTITAEGNAVVLNSANISYTVSLAVSGGTFSSAVAAEYCADGYEPKDNGDGTYGVQVVKTYVAQIGDKTYTSLEDAIAAAGNVATEIKIISDIYINLTEDVVNTGKKWTIDKDQNITIDLNGHAIAVYEDVIQEVASAHSFALFQNNGTLVIDDKTDEKAGSITFTHPYYKMYNSDYTATLYNITRNDFTNYGNLTVKNGLIKQDIDTTKVTEGAGTAMYTVDNYCGATFTMEGGQLYNYWSNAVRQVAYGEDTSKDNIVNISGGTVSGYYPIWMQTTNAGQKATLNISGGTINTTAKSGTTYIYNDSTGTATTINISGGTINDVLWVSAGNCNITGGTFNQEVYLHGNTDISGGTFNSSVISYLGYYAKTAQTFNITNGTFNGDINIFDYYGYGNGVSISGGKFAGPYDCVYAIYYYGNSGYYIHCISGGIFSREQYDYEENGETNTYTSSWTRELVAGKIATANVDETTKTEYPYAVCDGSVSLDVDYTYSESQYHDTCYYATLQEAVADAKDYIDNYSGKNSVIKLLADATLTSELEISDAITIDLNGHDIAAGTYSIKVENGGLNITGSGNITGAPSKYKLIYLVGSTDSTAENYSNVTIGENVKVKCTNGYAIMLSANNNAGFGVNITVNGTVEGYYGALYINGTVSPTTGKVPVVTLGSTGKLIADTESAAIFAAGYGTWDLAGDITAGSAIYAKTGEINITGGTLTANGAKTAYSYQASGYEITGDTIVVDNCNYPGGVPTVNITGGTFVSTNALQVGAYYGNGMTAIADIFSTKNTLTATEGYSWCATETAGTYKLAKAVASITSGDTITYYANLAEAYTAAADGQTIKLLADQSSERINLTDKSVTVNLNGFSLTGTSAYGVVFCPKNGNTITIDGTKTGSKIVGTIMCTSYTYGNIVVNGGTYEGNGYTPFYVNGSATQDCSITITDATITAESTGTQPETNHGLYLAGKNKTVLTNCTITGSNTGLEVRAGDVTLTNCTVNGNATPASFKAEANGSTVNGAAVAISQHTTDYDVKVTISGGTYTGVYAIYEDDLANETGTKSMSVIRGKFNGQVYSENCTGFISGGVYSVSPDTSYVASGYTVTDNKDETTKKVYPFTVAENGDPVAQIDETTYTKLATAISAANTGDTIKILADINLTAQQEITGKEITIDLNGKTIKYTGTTLLTSGVLLVHNGAGLTVTDSSDGANGKIDANGTGDANGDITSGAYAAVALTKAGDDSTNAAKLTVDAGNLEGFYYAVVGNGNRPNTEITVSGGTLKGTNTVSSQGIFHPQNGTLTITGGTIIGHDTAVEMRAGTIKVTGGKLTATATEYSCTPNESGSTTVGAALAIAQHSTKKNIAVTITGGTFTGVKAISESNPQENDPAPQVTMRVTGGYFNGEIVTADVNRFISGGVYTVKPAGKYIVDGVGSISNNDYRIVDGVYYEWAIGNAQEKVNLPTEEVNGNTVPNFTIYVDTNDKTSEYATSGTVANEVAEDITNNEATYGTDCSNIKNVTAELNAQIKINLKSVTVQTNESGASETTTHKVSYDVKPLIIKSDGEQIIDNDTLASYLRNAGASYVTFRLPVPTTMADEYVFVAHYADGAETPDSIKKYQVQGVAPNRYVEIQATSFSTYEIQDATVAVKTAMIGTDDYYATLQDAVDNAEDGDKITVLESSSKTTEVTVSKAISIEMDSYSGYTLTAGTGYTAATEGTLTTFTLNTYVVAVQSRIKGTDTSVAHVSGGGDQTPGSGTTITAQYVNGYKFLGWYTEYTKEITTDSETNKEYFGELYTNDLSFEYIPTAETTLTAVYEALEGNKITARIDASGSFTVNGEAQTQQYTKYVYVGQKMSIDYTGDGEFLYWVNESGNIITTSKSYSFTALNDLHYTAIASEDQSTTSVYVVFKNNDNTFESANIIQSSRITYTNGEEFEIEFPAQPPVLYGKTFDKWEFIANDGNAYEATNENIEILIGEGMTEFTIYPTYIDAEESHTVTITFYYNGENKGDDTEIVSHGDPFTYTVDQEKVTKNGAYYLDGYKINDKFVNYTNIFTARVTADINLSVYYTNSEIKGYTTEANSTVNTEYAGCMQDSETLKYTQTFVTSYAIYGIEDSDIATKGFMYTIGTVEDDDFNYENIGDYKVYEWNQATKANGIMTLNISGLSTATKKITVRSYIVLVDGTVIQGDIVRSNSN